jgi:predicted AlkP superfamily pyrophosphatase or phosphodiesterase
MIKPGLFPLMFAVLLLASCASVKTKENTNDQTVVLVSLDAFRWDFDSIYGAPILHDIARKGVSANELIPSFPTKTFPNHYSIATGLYPDHHGIINNSFYAPDLDKLYRIGDRDMVKNPAFYGGEPIWITAHKAGMITASFFWVGSEAIHPDYWKEFDNKVDFGARIDTVLKWLSYPESKRPRLVTLYFEEPDATAHAFGPVSPQTGKMVHQLDSLMGVLREGLKKVPGGKNIDLLILSDHGMGDIDRSRYNNILDTLPKRMIKSIVGGSPVWGCTPVEGKTDSILYFINMQKGVRAYKKTDLPENWHYGTNPRMPEIIVVANPRWQVGIKPELPGSNRGDHGYAREWKDMHSIFYAEGPAFRSGYKIDHLNNVDIYDIICHILKLKPAPNDGDENIIAPLFR